MNEDKKSMIGIYSSIERVRAAVTALRQDGFNEPVVYSPLDTDHSRLEATPAHTLIGWLALGGAAVGAAAGLTLTIGTSLQQPMITGGQPIISLPPLFVICFELTILFGVLATMLGMFWRIHRSNAKAKLYDSRFSMDRFGVYVTCEPDRVEAARRVLSSAGAEEVRDERL